MKQVDSSNFLVEEESIDLRKWVFLILRNWLFFSIILIISLSVATAYNYLADNEYEISAKVLIKESANPLDEKNIFKLSLNSDPYRLENEVAILSSSGILKRTLLELNFFVEYYLEENFRTVELNHNAPFLIVLDTFHQQPVNYNFEINILSDSLVAIYADGTDVELYNFTLLRNNGKTLGIEIDDTLRFGEKFSNEFASFTIIPRKNYLMSEYVGKNYLFRFRSLHSLVNQYRNIEINIPNESSILDVTLKSKNLEKAARFLNKLLDNYLLKGIEREDEIAKRTVDFIDYQLVTLVDSLKASEQLLENYRSTNRLVDVGIQAEKAYTRQSELEKQRAELIMQKRYLEFLKQNLKSNSLSVEELIAPSTMGISDAVLNNLVMDLVGLYNERTELTLNARKETPYIASLDVQIESLKQKLAETVENIYDATQISLDEVASQTKVISGRLSRLPKEQRELLKYERNFQLNDELYTFLLTRRSEMQIKMASNIPANEILEEADSYNATLVHPNKKLNYILAFFLGLLFPFGIIYLRVTLNDRIESIDELKNISDFPIMGTINRDNVDDLPCIVHHPASIVSESFRMLRANMQFVLTDESSPVVVVTSAMKGEGKSFTAINFAAACASYSKKVCLIDLDLRRPKIADYLKLNSDKGMSNYLIGKTKSSDIIRPVCNGLFDVIPSGPVPPNPSELIASHRLNELIEQLSKKYERIIIDSPPIGMISDTMFISKNARHLLMVVRHGVTHKKLLESVLEEFNRNQLKGVNLIFNDVPFGAKGYYRYGSRYSYYYTSEKKGFLSGLFKD